MIRCAPSTAPRPLVSDVRFRTAVVASPPPFPGLLAGPRVHRQRLPDAHRGRGWHLYQLTGNVLDLGLVGLVEFAPRVLFMLHTGHVADRYDRRKVAALCQSLQGLIALALALGSATDNVTRELIFALAFLLGATRSFEMPATQALLPNVVPAGLFPRAVAASASAAVGNHCGAGGGRFPVCLRQHLGIRPHRGPVRHRLYADPEPAGARPSGPARARQHRIAAGRHPLHSQPARHPRRHLAGPVRRTAGRGHRAAAGVRQGHPADRPAGPRPAALGAGGGGVADVAVAGALPVRAQRGRTMFTAVGVFGVATIAFGLSTSFWFSLAVLVVLGAADMISMVIRGAFVQLETPDEMRGRVSAVNGLFIGASNQLGEFESGVTAHWFGTVPAVVLGGVGTLVVTGVWIKLFPTLAKRDRLHNG